MFVVKPGGHQKPPKRKARGVVCGNFVPNNEGADYAACQTDSTALRLVLVEAAKEGYDLWGVDVKTAFLNAYLDDDDIVVVKPPTIFISAGATEEGSLWWVKKALYGLRQAPGCWQRHRDQALMTIRVEEYKMIPMKSDPGLWRIVGRKTPNETRGFAVTYVDDVLVMAEGDLGSKFIKAIQDLWETSQAEVLRSPFKEKGNEEGKY